MAARAVGRQWWLAAAIVVAVGGAAWVGAGVMARRTLAASLPVLPDIAALPAAVQTAVREAEAAARATPDAATIGAYGRACHGAQLAECALGAYRVAEALAPDDLSWTYLRALLLEERGDDDAIAAFVGVTTRQPAHGHAWFRLGEAHFKRGRLDDAAAAYTRAEAAPAVAAFTPPGVTSRQTWALGAYAGVGLARVALDRGDTAAARTRLATLAAAYPAFSPARGLLRQLDARETSAAGSYVPPADPVVDALVASSRHSDLLLKHAGLATRAGDTAWREFLVRRALEFNADDLNVLMAMAELLQSTRRPAEALPFLTRLETLAPGDHHALVEHGRVLGDLNRLSEAEAVLRRALPMRDPAAEYNLGTVLDRMGRWDEARGHYERAIALNPFHTRAMNNLAAGLNRRGQTAVALGLFERAVSVAPDAADIHVNYGVALTDARRFAQAVAVLTTAIALDPRDPNPHNNLGIAFASMGDLPRAKDAFARALAIDPRNTNARRNHDRVTAALASR
jgi:tetratricopeptide (TPR) repeat protein